MLACTFFGHRDCPSNVKPKLREVLVDLIEHHGVNLFYVGNQGAFDALARLVLQELVLEYPHIAYSVVLAYMPAKRDEFDVRDHSDTMLPEGIELAHPRYAIRWRNKWMLRQSDFVVSYIAHQWGGAAQFVKSAEREGKMVINLYSDIER